MCLSSTTIELLEWIKNVTGYGTIKNKKNYNPNKHKDSYTYFVKYNDAINLMKEIEPYLVINSKKERVKLIIENYKRVTPRNGRYSEEMKKAKEEFYKEFMSIN